MTERETLLSVTMRRVEEGVIFELVTRDGHVIANVATLESDDAQSLHLAAVFHYEHVAVHATVQITTRPSRTEPAIEVAKQVLVSNKKGGPPWDSKG